MRTLPDEDGLKSAKGETNRIVLRRDIFVDWFVYNEGRLLRNSFLILSQTRSKSHYLSSNFKDKVRRSK